MIEFIGNSGRFYIKNPHDNDKYSYACYKSKDDLSIMTGYVGHLSIDKALADFNKIEKENKWRFEIKIGGATKVFITDLKGTILEPKVKNDDFAKYYSLLNKKYGKENVKINKTKI